jgi:hypothetical protein
MNLLSPKLVVAVYWLLAASGRNACHNYILCTYFTALNFFSMHSSLIDLSLVYHVVS